MVWGAWFLTAHGAGESALTFAIWALQLAFSALWLLAGWMGWTTALDRLALPVAIVALLATSYTGFLFAQGLGRDLWQGPTAAIDLVAQSGAAGAASLLLVAALTNGGGAVVPVLGTLLAGSLAAHLVILMFEHLLSPSPTRHHELAVKTITSGAYARLFWGAAIAGGGLVPLAILLTVGAGGNAALTIGAALLALAGGAAWEYIWVEAGQSVPLS